MEGTEAADCLYRLNAVIDSWRTQSLYAYASQRVAYTLPGNSTTATIGPTGNIVVPYRPIRLEVGSFYNSGGLDYQLDMLTLEQFNSISQKGLATAGPSGVYYEPTIPNGTLYFYPQPGSDVNLTLVLLTELLEFPALNTDYTLPPGYRRALAYALAEDMAADYNRPMSPSAMKASYLSLRNIRRANHTTPQLEVFIGDSSTNANNLFTSPANNVFDGGGP